MDPLPYLDEELQAKVLTFVAEPVASTTCVTWKEKLYESLYIGPRAQFNSCVRKTGGMAFSYNAMRPLAEDFEESVSYNFAFRSGGTYTMQWARTFDAWSSQSEQHVGVWRLYLDQVFCETTCPGELATDREVRYAPPGYKFEVPVHDILKADGTYFQAPLGSPAERWELPARTGKYEDGDTTRTRTGMWQAPDVVTTAEARQMQVNPDSRFVEIDGEMHAVSGDIVANWPEHEWARLMRCRLRFGING